MSHDRVTSICKTHKRKYRVHKVINMRDMIQKYLYVVQILSVDGWRTIGEPFYSYLNAKKFMDELITDEL